MVNGEVASSMPSSSSSEVSSPLSLPRPCLTCWPGGGLVWLNTLPEKCTFAIASSTTCHSDALGDGPAATDTATVAGDVAESGNIVSGTAKKEDGGLSDAGWAVKVERSVPGDQLQSWQGTWQWNERAIGAKEGVNKSQDDKDWPPQQHRCGHAPDAASMSAHDRRCVHVHVW
jgi:hypothetical protein